MAAIPVRLDLCIGVQRLFRRLQRYEHKAQRKIDPDMKSILRLRYGPVAD
jgi:hypothetical protein